ncbi:MAG: holliday junction helicase RuvA [Solirubrobacterales bacterium]|nr:holliday junction helicase RuvA [Solirubrobacterales bacterium]
MIASVRGEVLERRPDHVVIEASGVGYRLAVSAETLSSVPAVGNETTMLAHLIVRDDSMALYGFATEAERDLFQNLISVSGVGPKVAVAILSGGSPRELSRAIALGDHKRFQAAPGVGKRTAERVIVELREKVAAELQVAGSAGANSDDPHILARDGLMNLGYALDEAERMLEAAEGETPEELIGAALRSAGSAEAA